jgi:hypothetical protein
MVDANPLTIVVQVLAVLVVSVAPSGNVKVSLHLVQIQTAVDAAAIATAAAPYPGRLAPLGPLLAERDNVVDVLLAETLVLVAGARDDLAVGVTAELVHALGVHPLRPVGRVLLQAVGGQNAVARGILHVDAQVLALHAQHDVEVDLQLVADALLDSKRVVLGALPPVAHFSPEEEEGDDGDGDGPLAAARGARDILRF